MGRRDGIATKFALGSPLVSITRTGHTIKIGISHMPTAPPDAVVALWRENLTARLDLGPLESQAVDEIVDQALEGVLDTVSRRELHRICRATRCCCASC